MADSNFEIIASEDGTSVLIRVKCRYCLTFNVACWLSRWAGRLFGIEVEIEEVDEIGYG